MARIKKTFIAALLPALLMSFSIGCGAQGQDSGKASQAAQECCQGAGQYWSVDDWFRCNLGPDTPKEAEMRAAGLIDIHDLDSTFAVKMIYCGPYNFMGHQLYHGFTKAMMRPELAKKLVAANKQLKALRPTLNLIIYDAARPISIQKEMWDSVVGTPASGYVANPYKGNGLHNYGAAVDVAIIDCTGNPIPMGSEYDFFGAEARTDDEANLLKSGKITRRELDNRLLLRKVMQDNGLKKITSEWWHFNLMSADEARAKLKIIE